MDGIVLIAVGLFLIGWAMFQAPTRPSTPELYDEYKRKRR